jgi:cytochrome c oxidase subunit 4
VFLFLPAMQSSSRLLLRPVLAARRRCYATATAGHAAHAAPAPAAESKRPVAAIPLSNIEAQWALLSPDEKTSVAEQLEDLQKRDWKLLSGDEKKAGERVSLALILASLTVVLDSILRRLWSPWPAHADPRKG